MKKTTNEIVRTLKIKKPNFLVQKFFGALARMLYYKKCGVEIFRHIDVKKYANQPVIVVANHASRMDYAFVNYAMKGRKINFVAAENEFHRSHLKTVFRIAHVIPKKKFCTRPDHHQRHGKNSQKGEKRLRVHFPLRNEHRIGCTATQRKRQRKRLKHFGVTVLRVLIHGGYFVSPKFDVKERYGKVEVELDELFTPQQLRNMSEQEIQLQLDKALFTDDYEWNKTRQHSYKCNWGYANNLEQLMYKCPKCGAEMQMKGEGCEIKCLKCGNGGTLDSRYNLVPFEGSVLPENLRVWFDDQRRAVRKEVLQSDFCMQEHVKIGTMPKYGYIPNKAIGYIVGEGTLRLDKSGLSFEGTRDGKPFSVFVSGNLVDTLLFPVDASFFYTYASGEFLYFVPDTLSCTKWHLAVEEVYRTNGGKWQNYPWFNYEEDTPLEGYPLAKQ